MLVWIVPLSHPSSRDVDYPLNVLMALILSNRNKSQNEFPSFQDWSLKILKRLYELRNENNISIAKCKQDDKAFNDFFLCQCKPISGNSLLPIFSFLYISLGEKWWGKF